MNLSTKQKQTRRHREQTCDCQGWGRERGGRGDCNSCKLLHLKWVNNKVLMYSTGNHIEYAVINHNGKEF